MRNVALAALVAGFGAVACSTVLAADYPAKPVKLMHGFAAGGNADIISRVLAEAMSNGLGQAVVVEPKPGAGGNIAADVVAKAAPDGYTLILLTGGHTVSAGLYKQLAFDPIGDFATISTVVFFPFVISVRADAEAKTLKEYLVTAKAMPNYGTGGVGTTMHLVGELLASMTGTPLSHVPYRGGAAATQALLGGEIQMAIDPATAPLPHIRAGKLRALAVTGNTRWRGLAEVPTVAEAGVAGFDVTSWAAVATSKGAPRPIVDRLNAELHRVIALPAVRQKLEEVVGGEVRGSTPEEMRALLVAEVARWGKVIRDAKIPQQ